MIIRVDYLCIIMVLGEKNRQMEKGKNCYFCHLFLTSSGRV